MSTKPTSRDAQARKAAAATGSQAESPQTGGVPDETRVGRSPADETERRPEAAEAGELPRRLGRYAIRGKLGEGQFGVVYDGFDEQLHRRVAVKVPSRDVQQADFQAFQEEARRLARLKHPGIVAVHDAGIDAGRCYLVSDFVSGPSLKEWLSDHRPNWQQAAEIAAHLADALGHAHAQRTVHRDIKPANIVLSEGLRPVILDFGLSLSETWNRESRGWVCGTPAYMSPEQARGEGHRIDGRTDIYSLGVVLFEMLCGCRPFEGDDVAELLRRVREEAPQPPRQLAPEIPAALEALVLRAMAKRPSERFNTAGDMARQLQSILLEHAGLDPLRAAATGSRAIVSLDPGRPCPRCDRISPVADAYCNHCGSPLGLARGASQPDRSDGFAAAAVLGEPSHVTRRHLTVLACQCDAPPSADAESQHELLQIFRQICVEAAEAYGGLALDAGGRGLQVCFGYPQAREDAALRAVLCGRRILGEMERLAIQLDSTASAPASPAAPTACIAIHSGDAVVESRAARPAHRVTIVGDVAAVAGRLEALTEPGCIWLSDATRALIRHEVPCRFVGERQLARTRPPTGVYRVDAPDEVGRDASEQVLGPLFGRDGELALLHHRWRQALEGRGQLVSVVGEAGIGKTHLVRHARAEVLQRTEARVLEMRCAAWHDREMLYPLTDMLARCCNFQRRDSAAARLDKLVRHLAEIGLAENETVQLFAALLSIPLDERFPMLALSADSQRDKTLEALVSWILRTAERHPLLLIAEDLQWADETTRTWLGRLAPRLADSPSLLIATFRPAAEPTLGISFQEEDFLSQATRLVLQPLLPSETRRLLRHALEGCPLSGDLQSELARQSDGIPLFVELLVDACKEAPERPINELLPARLCDLLLARVDAVARHPPVIQIAALIGRRFELAPLQAIAELSPESVREELERFVDAGLLRLQKRAGRAIYTFQYALLPALIQHGMLRKQREPMCERLASLSAETGLG